MSSGTDEAIEGEGTASKRSGDEESEEIVHVSFGQETFQVNLADCFPCVVAKSNSSHDNNNDNAISLPRKKKLLRLQDCFGDWGSPPIDEDFVSTLDADSDESPIIPRSFRFGSYPFLNEFLLENKDDFYHHSANCRTNKAHEYNNNLTLRLIQLAGSKGYHFQCLYDDGIIGDDLPAGVDQLPPFKRIRDKIRNFFQRLKSNSASSADPPTQIVGDPELTAAGKKTAGKKGYASTGTDTSSTEMQATDASGNADAMDIEEVSNESADGDAVVDNTQKVGGEAAQAAARIVPHSWHWSQYNCFEKFLLQNQKDFVYHATRHAGTQTHIDYVNTITEELLVLANQNGYRFQCMDDCEEGDMGQVSARTGFAFLRHRIKTYYKRQVQNENRRIARRDLVVNHEPSSPAKKRDENLLSPAAMEKDLSTEGKAALRALFQTFIRRGTVDTMQLAKAVEATGYTDTFILESARRARQRLLLNSSR